MSDFNCQLVKQNARYDGVLYRLLIDEKLVAPIVIDGKAALPPLTLAPVDIEEKEKEISSLRCPIPAK